MSRKENNKLLVKFPSSRSILPELSNRQQKLAASRPQYFTHFLPRNPLLRNKVAQGTAYLYCKAVGEFLVEYNRDRPKAEQLQLNELTGLCTKLITPQQLLLFDQAVFQFITDQFLQRQSDRHTASTAGHLLHGLLWLQPHLRDHLHWTHTAILSWRRHRPAFTRPPRPWRFAVNMAVAFTLWNEFPAAVAIILAFDCYLRTDEFFHLRIDNVSFPGKYNDSTQISLRLESAKTGLNQFVLISRERQAIGELLKLLIKQRLATPGITESDRLFPFESKREFRRQFKLVRDSIGLGRFKFTPHSLRHGGASHDMLKENDIGAIMKRGRWKSMKGVNSYLQAGRSIYIQYEALAAQDNKQLECQLDNYGIDYVVKKLLKLEQDNYKAKLKALK